MGVQELDVTMGSAALGIHGHRFESKVIILGASCMRFTRLEPEPEFGKSIPQNGHVSS
jgi:hypothetical protein